MLEPNTRYLQQQRLKAIQRHAKAKNYTDKSTERTLCAGRTKMIIFNSLLSGWVLCEWVNAMKWIVITDHHHHRPKRQSASLLSSLNHWRSWFLLRNTIKAFQDEIVAGTLCEMRELDDRTMSLAWKWKTIPISMRSQMLRNWNAFQLNDRWSIHFFSVDSMDGFLLLLLFIWMN